MYKTNHRYIWQNIALEIVDATFWLTNIEAQTIIYLLVGCQRLSGNMFFILTNEILISSIHDFVARPSGRVVVLLPVIFNYKGLTGMHSIC